MQHPMHRVVSFAIVGPHELEIGFEDGVVAASISCPFSKDSSSAR